MDIAETSYSVREVKSTSMTLARTFLNAGYDSGLWLQDAFSLADLDALDDQSCQIVKLWHGACKLQDSRMQF